MRIVCLLLFCCFSLGLCAQVLESEDQICGYFEKDGAKKTLSKKEVVDRLWKQNFLVQVKVNSAGNVLVDNDSLGVSCYVDERGFSTIVDFMNLYPHEVIVYLFQEHETQKSDTTAEVIEKYIQVVKEHSTSRQKQMEKYFSRTELPKPVIMIKPGSFYYGAIVDSLKTLFVSPPSALILSDIVWDINDESENEPEIKKVEKKKRLKYSGSDNNTKEYLVFHVDSMMGYPDRTEVFITHFTPNESVGISRNCILKNTVTGEQMKIKDVRGDVGFENKKVIPGSRLSYVLIFPPVQSDWKEMKLTCFQETNIDIKLEGEWLTDKY